MRKLKKSVKIIIISACVLVVAAASILTAVLLHKNRKNKGDNTPSVPAYSLTDEQIALGKEISSVTSTAVSANKLQPVEYSSKLEAVLPVENITYLDNSVLWHGSNNNYTDLFFIDSQGNPEDLLTKINSMNFVDDGYVDSVIRYAGKNHFSVSYKYSDEDTVRIVCSVVNHQIVLNKKFELVNSFDETRYNGDIFRIALDEDFFVVMLETDGKYFYEFFDYLSDYTNYESFKIEADDIYDGISCVNGAFVVGDMPGEVVAYKTESGLFALIQENDVLPEILLKNNVKIIQSTTEYDEKTENTELVSGKYVEYSYKLAIGAEEKELSIGDSTKISAVSYVGNNYFGVFVQDVDENNALKSVGTMIYFDYDLNVVVRYPASAAISGGILYSNDEFLLTSEGAFSGKNTVDCNKIHDFAKNGLEFVDVLSNGDCLLKDKAYNYVYVYNLNFEKLLGNRGFDSVVSYIDDNNLVFLKDSEYFLYNVRSRANPVKIQYIETDVSANTSMYLIKNENDDNASLYSGTQLINDSVSRYDDGDNYLTYEYSNSQKKTLYFVEKTEISEIRDVSFSASAVYGGTNLSFEPVYGAAPSPGHEKYIEEFDLEPEWYEYDDKVAYVGNKEDDETIVRNGVDYTGKTYKFTHTFRDGRYSKTNFVDYLEIHYTGEGGGSNYWQYRIYYRVDILNGNPQLKIISRGHHQLTSQELAAGVPLDTNSLTINGKNYTINTTFALNSANSGYADKNMAYAGSYDYSKNYDGQMMYYYYYTDTTTTADGSGVFLHTDNTYDSFRQCSAEVYGNSIRVTFYLDFIYTTLNGSTSYSRLNVDNWRFGNEKGIIPGVIEDDYYNQLYYQSVVVGYSREDVNYYKEIIDSPETYLPITYEKLKKSESVYTAGKEYFVDNIGLTPYVYNVADWNESGVLKTNTVIYEKVVAEELTNVAESSIVTDHFVNAYLKDQIYTAESFNRQIIYSSGYSSNRYTACISSKTTLTKEEDEYTKLILGGELLKTNIVGAQIVGITSLNQTNHKNITIKSLYDTSLTSGSRNYIDDMVDFRVLPLREDSADDEDTEYKIDIDGKDNPDSFVKQKYLKYDKDAKTYSIEIYNEDYIYCAGGLNTYRYVFCVFEPQTFYFDVDYNISGEEMSIGNEINYLQSYLGLSVGLDYRNDYVQYTKSWVYRNALEYGEDGKTFGTYDNENNDKYYPYDFTNVETRQEIIDLSDKTEEEILEIRKKNENQAKIYEYKLEKERYFYVVIDGVKYYFQMNLHDPSVDYSKDFSFMIEDSAADDADKQIFVSAYKNIDDLKLQETFNLYGKIASVDIANYYDEDEYYNNPAVRGVYSANVAEVYLRIPKSVAADKSHVAYFHEVNVHKRDDSKVVYNGFYSFDAHGNVIDPGGKPDPDAEYKISETFSFLYTDNIIFSRLPQHTHYDFVGWKVKIKLSNGSVYEYDIDMTDVGLGVNMNTNLTNDKHPFLAEYEGGTINKRFFDIWRKIEEVEIEGTEQKETVITWKNLISNPITLVAQWVPKQCDVEAVLYVKSGSEYNGYMYSADSGYVLQNIANNATSVPTYKIGDDNIDCKDNKTNASVSDGILDFSESTKFDYSLDIDFADIGYILTNNGFNQTQISTVGLGCQFVGWAFLKTDDGDGEVISIVNEMDPRAKETNINEYIGDTTTLRVYAFYAQSRYNFFLRFNAMGGATLSDGVKDYYSDYDYTLQYPPSGNGNIYNAVKNPAIYEIALSKSTDLSNPKLYRTEERAGYNTLDMVSGTYGVDVKDETNTFMTGDSVVLKISLNEQYYAKTIKINNIILRSDQKDAVTNSYLLDYYNLTFTYDYDSGDNSWKWTAEAKSIITYNILPASPHPTKNGYFKFGSFGQNDNNNAIKIARDSNDLESNSWVITIETLSNPGEMYTTDDYIGQKIEGVDGFTLSVYPESYTIETESVTVYAKEGNENITDQVFGYNNAMLVSSQPLTNVEGKELELDKACYIWLGTTKYLFENHWSASNASGYYNLSNKGTVNATLYENYTYEEFVRQRIKENENLVVYYDATEQRVYYPAQYSAVGNIYEYQTRVSLSPSGYRYYFYIDDSVYFINMGIHDLEDINNTSADTPFKDLDTKYYPAFLSQHQYSLTANEDDYNNADFYYEKYRHKIIVYFDAEKRTVKYKSSQQPQFSIGYNNTRVLAIDPDQERLYLSDSPALSARSTYYDLNYYLASLTIGNTTLTFNKLSRNIYSSTSGDLYYYYGLLELSLASVELGSSIITRREDIYFNNLMTFRLDMVRPGYAAENNHYYKIINYFGEKYIIQDAYIITIPNEGKVDAATTYYFYLTRSERGFTKYFIIYDEKTTNLNNVKQNHSISLTFRRLNKNLTIIANEEDLYDASNRSFEISYAEKDQKYAEGSDGLGGSRYQFNNDIFFEDILADEDLELDGNTFYQVKGESMNDVLSLLDPKTLRELTTMQWQSSYEFTPATNRRLIISAKSGYIISYIKVYIGTKAGVDINGDEIEESYENIMTFKFIDESLDDLYYNAVGGNYSYSSVVDNKLVSYISYTIENELSHYNSEIDKAYGYKLLNNEYLGLYYSNFYNTSWGFGDQGTFNFDHLYLLLAGLYEDVKIEFGTTSYTEFLFEDGESGTQYNPLIDQSNFHPTTEDVYYEEIPLSATYLNIYTMKYDDETDGLILDKSLNDNKVYDKDGNDTGEKIFTLRYYHKNSDNNIKKNSIRIIFYGTGSKIKYGLHFLATHETYSVYFTDGRFYNEELSATNQNPFKSLEAFSGRTSENLGINTTARRDGSNKMVYMFTGALHKEKPDGTYDGFFVNTNYPVKNESTFKFFVATTAYVNLVGINTDSYLYNDSMTDDTTLRVGLTTENSHVITDALDDPDNEYAGKRVSYGYPLVDGDYQVVIRDGSYLHFQLDAPLHKKRSWFNDTVLSNIQLFSYLDAEPNALPKTWSNRNVENESELTRVELGGLDFSWRYYEIPGYYLRYLMIKIADLDTYFVVDLLEAVPKGITISDGETIFIKKIRIYNPGKTTGRSYDYNFNLYYHKEADYSYYQLFPVFHLTEEDGDQKIDEFTSVSLMSNDITVRFMLMAYDYNIKFTNYNFSGTGISTSDSLMIKVGTSDYLKRTNNTVNKIIYYDSMIPIDITQKMTGYSFIGWGSENYFVHNGANGQGDFYSRFRAGNGNRIASEWDSRCVWYDPTAYFPQEAVFDAEEKNSAEQNNNLLLKLVSKYSETTTQDYARGAFYSDGAYFMTDTGIKAEGLYTQNYNFFADYLGVFSRHMSNSVLAINGIHSGVTAIGAGRTFELYGIWKPNTYAIEFDINNYYGDAFHVDYNTNLFAYEFTEDKIGFRKIAKTEEDLNTRTNLMCYVVFDTINWFSLASSGDKLMYSAMGNHWSEWEDYLTTYENQGDPKGPYAMSELEGVSAVSKLAVDMFGYTWLGWSSVRRDNIRINNYGTSISDPYRLFDSFYTNEVNPNSISGVPTFNKTFIDKMKENKTIYELEYRTGNVQESETDPYSQKFVYYGMHKATTGLNPIDGYVCFYDYSYKEDNGNSEFGPYADFDVKGVKTMDYLNMFRTKRVIRQVMVDDDKNGLYESENRTDYDILYGGEHLDSIRLSYYDTVLSDQCYSVRRNGQYYSVKLTKTAQTVRRIKLFANWSENRYLIFTDTLDAGSSFYNVGSSYTNNFYGGGNYVFFNDPSMSVILSNRIQPTRIGYDFLGWSLSYLPPHDDSIYKDLIASINTPGQYIYLCKELLAEYASLNGALYTSDLESNVLMHNYYRLNEYGSNTWILNRSGYAERLGDRDKDIGLCVYLFPIWSAQTFSINISLNITAEDLYNLHEKDSSFAIALYEGADERCKTVTGVNSMYYTYNRNSASPVSLVVSDDRSPYFYYYTDIVANVHFEIEFDKEFNSAVCSFAGKSYYLKDLMMTSAGYYFMGLMTNYSVGEEEDEATYLMRNLLRTTIELDDGLVHHDEEGNELDQGGFYYSSEEYLSYSSLNFDYQTYFDLINSKFSSGYDSIYGYIPYYHSGVDDLSVFDYVETSSYGGITYYSSNFGTISFSAKNHITTGSVSRVFNIMSERDGNEFYLFIIHNNVKYYVVYYNSINPYSQDGFENTITWDRTFLYYNVRDALGNVINRYVIRFDEQGKAYYVKDSFKNRVELNLDIALYTTRRNTLNVSIGGSSPPAIIEYSPSSPNGSLTYGNAVDSITLIGTGSYVLSNKATREFTLFADWELRKITTTMVNGNNYTYYNEETGQEYVYNGGLPHDNEGLAGYYKIEDLNLADNLITSNDAYSRENRISLTYDFYSDVNHMILPYYEGRFLSELTIEFDTLAEDGSGDVTTHRMTHNTLVFKFAWDNVNHKIYITSVTRNGLVVGGAFTSISKGVFALNTFSGIDILSFLDFRNLNDSSYNSGFKLYNNGVTQEGYYKNYVNEVNIDLKKVMTSVKMTSKFSVQTFKVEVYNVVSDTGLDTNFTTSFGSINSMHMSSNYFPENVGLYGAPYVSSLNYQNAQIPVISADCGANTYLEYNVPFYYFITENVDVELSYDDVSPDSLRSIYDMGYYYNGYYGSKITSNNGQDLNELRLEKDGIAFERWCSNPRVEGALVRFDEYNQYQPVVDNTVIYGYYTKADSVTKVLFYYWKDGQYVQYTNNEAIYTSGSEDSEIAVNGETASIKHLPSPSIAPWYGTEEDSSKQFVGYVYINDKVYRELVAIPNGDSVKVNEDYNSARYKATNTFTETTADIYSAFYMNRLGFNSHGSGNIDTYVDNYIKTFSLTDIFAHRLEVQNNKYFTSKDDVLLNGRYVKVLDGVRVAITIGGGYQIIKDLKMLNTATELKAGETTHAIPIYEEIKLNVKDVFAYKDKAVITSNTNMIESNVFETNMFYTIYHDPRDLRVTVSANGGYTMQDLSKLDFELNFKADGTLYNDKMYYFNFDGVVKTDNTRYDYRQFKFDTGLYVYIYYVKVSMNIYDSTVVYMASPFYVEPNQVHVETLPEMYYSPIEDELTEENLEVFRTSFEIIQDDESIDDLEKRNRQRLIYIMLQLSQGIVPAAYKDMPDDSVYFSTSGVNPNIRSYSNYNISQCVRAINYYDLGILDSVFVPNAIYTDVNYFSIYRLAYSLASYFIEEQKICDIDGLANLYGDSNIINEKDVFAESVFEENKIKEDSFCSDDQIYGEIKPGDILASYRYNHFYSMRLIHNALTGGYYPIFTYEDEEKLDVKMKEEIYSRTWYEMYIGQKDGTFYFANHLGIFTSETFDNESYQIDDTFDKFYHGSSEWDYLGPQNGLWSGNFTMNPSEGSYTEIIEVDEDGFFNYDGESTPYYLYGSYYWDYDSLEDASQERFDECKAYYIHKLWEKYDEDLTNYQIWKVYLESKAKHDEWLAKKAEWDLMTQAEKDANPDKNPGDEPLVKPVPTVPKVETEPTEPAFSRDGASSAQPKLYDGSSAPNFTDAMTYVTSYWDESGLTRYDIVQGTGWGLSAPATKQLVELSRYGYASDYLYSEYYYYQEGREYYVGYINEEENDYRGKAGYGTGWDGPPSNNNYWLIFGEGTSVVRIYSRWKNFYKL